MVPGPDKKDIIVTVERDQAHWMCELSSYQISPMVLRQCRLGFTWETVSSRDSQAPGFYKLLIQVIDRLYTESIWEGLLVHPCQNCEIKPFQEFKNSGDFGVTLFFSEEVAYVSLMDVFAVLD